ncbi:MULTISPECIES: hypothetical protein [unclassified Maridesulfovibrio]|uniref:hypothetical protein n=1 Tax=unclassified Maridesulfovibrio TaxID=2794999 RepID=UPI003B3E69D1
MLIDTNNMTVEQINVLVNQLLGPIVAALHGNAKVMVQSGDIFKEVPICIIDRGQIGKQTHAELDTAWTELDAATTAATRITALTKIVTAQQAILVGRKGD